MLVRCLWSLWKLTGGQNLGIPTQLLSYTGALLLILYNSHARGLTCFSIRSDQLLRMRSIPLGIDMLQLLSFMTNTQTRVLRKANAAGKLAKQVGVEHSQWPQSCHCGTHSPNIENLTHPRWAHVRRASRNGWANDPGGRLGRGPGLRAPQALHSRRKCGCRYTRAGRVGASILTIPTRV